MTKERWINTVDSMMHRGATISDEEYEEIVNYLATNLSGTTKPPQRVKGSGLVSMTLTCLVTIFIAGLKAGRTPEYPGNDYSICVTAIKAGNRGQRSVTPLTVTQRIFARKPVKITCFGLWSVSQ
jgi:hypothetical protein